MTSFAPQTAPLNADLLDPTKYVNYTPGMVLGVEDFKQEHVYVTGRNQWLARDLIGYGTVYGLEVSFDGQQITVAQGVALSPQGQLIRVPAAQCARLDEWLALPGTQQQLNTFAGPSPTNVVLQVVLRYSDCLTDNAPVAGEPCRSADEAMAPSRVLDNFVLELRLAAAQPNLPDQTDEDAVREFAALLDQIQVTNDPGLALTLDQFVGAIRSAVAELKLLLGTTSNVVLASPPAFTYGSPATPLYIPAANASEYMRTALRIWVTEIRPQLQGQTQVQGYGVVPEEEYVLLSDIHVPVMRDASGTWRISNASGITVDDTRRPYLLHLRLLQELLLASQTAAVSAASNAVEHPGGQGDYAIVAAGIVSGDGKTARSPVYNGLRVNGAPQDGLLTFTFNTYKQPDNATFQYIVKVLPVSNSLMIIVNFDHFDVTGFVISAKNNTGALIPVAQLAQHEFMIEVSRYSRGA
ncbi:MAG TPA: hypothetical protein VF043_17945 [Ktedonobacteraceae bacterium]